MQLGKQLIRRDMIRYLSLRRGKHSGSFNSKMILLASGITLILAVLLLWKWPIVYRRIRLHEWGIYRWSCWSDLTGSGQLRSPPTSRPEVSHPRFISHAFHPTVGLGNLLFMYAAMYGMAKKNDLLPAIKYYSKLYDVMEVDRTYIRDFDISACDNAHFGMEECCIYDKNSEHISEMYPGRNVSLWSYFQSHRYFHPEYKEDIRRHFSFKPEVLATAGTARRAAIYEATGKYNVSRPIVGIHVRRGDIMEKVASNFGQTTATRKYYINAAKELESRGVKDPIFIVCTNDIEWSQQNIPLKNIGFTRNTSPAVDMALLSSADHLILSVGTYSFFAGYLSNAKNIFYFARWPEPDSAFAKMTDLGGFWLPEWTALE